MAEYRFLPAVLLIVHDGAYHDLNCKHIIFIVCCYADILNLVCQVHAIFEHSHHSPPTTPGYLVTVDNIIEFLIKTSLCRWYLMTFLQFKEVISFVKKPPDPLNCTQKSLFWLSARPIILRPSGITSILRLLRAGAQVRLLKELSGKMFRQIMTFSSKNLFFYKIWVDGRKFAVIWSIKRHTIWRKTSLN